MARSSPTRCPAKSRATPSRPGPLRLSMARRPNQSGARRESETALFRALVNPGADQPDLLGSQRLGRGTESARSTSAGSARRPSSPRSGRIAAAGPDGRTSARSTRSTTELAAWPAGFRLGRHGEFLVYLRDGDDYNALVAVAGNHDLPVLAAFERGFKAIEA